MIRVGFDIHTVGQRATGNETYTEGLLQAYAANPAADIDFTYYHCGALPARNWPGSYRRLYPRMPTLRIPIATPLALLRDRIDVAHFQYFQPPLSPCPIVLTIHDISFERFPEFFPPAMSRRLQWLVPFMVRRAAHIITVSEATREDLVSCYGLAPEKISVIYNGTSERFCTGLDQQQLRERIARFNLSRPFAVSVGNLGTRKNQQRLVRCFSQLLQRDAIEYDLVLVGKPLYQAEAVLAELDKQGTAGRIHVTGFVTQDELVALYSLAQFSVYPSLFEGFGLPILESMACGTPVITSNCSCMPEIAGDAALLVDPLDDEALSDALLTLSSNTALRQQLARAGLQRQAAFTWKNAGRRTLDVYRQVAG